MHAGYQRWASAGDKMSKDCARSIYVPKLRCFEIVNSSKYVCENQLALYLSLTGLRQYERGIVDAAWYCRSKTCSSCGELVHNYTCLLLAIIRMIIRLFAPCPKVKLHEQWHGRCHVLPTKPCTKWASWINGCSMVIYQGHAAVPLPPPSCAPTAPRFNQLWLTLWKLCKLCLCNIIIL